jgi:hypothetical protein
VDRENIILDLSNIGSILEKLPNNMRHKEFTQVRYTTAFREPKDVAKDRHILRWTLRKRTPTCLLVSVFLDDDEPAKALPLVLDRVCGTLDSFSTVGADEERLSRERIPFGRGGWAKRVLHLHCGQFPTQDVATYLQELGVRPVWHAVDGKREQVDHHFGSEYIRWHMFEARLEFLLLYSVRRLYKLLIQSVPELYATSTYETRH